MSGTSDNAVGVAGSSLSGVGVSGESKLDNGVLGSTAAAKRAGVFGRCTADRGNGIAGLAQGALGVGVFGTAELRGVGVVGTGATGVVGQGESGPGVQASSAESHGVVGMGGKPNAPPESQGRVRWRWRKRSRRSFARPRRARGKLRWRKRGPGKDQRNQIRRGPRADTVAGVKGVSVARAPGIVGQSAGGIGVIGLGNGTDNVVPELLNPGAGVMGLSAGSSGVFGFGAPGVLGWASGAPGAPGHRAPPAVVAFGGVGAIGSVGVLGRATVAGSPKVSGGSKQFVIDHPLDPENRYLHHAAVEAPALKTFYDGTVTIDETGQARVTLPAWFSALNSDLCYSLTSLGGPAPDLHVAQEFDGEGFTIGGGLPAREHAGR